MALINMTDVVIEWEHLQADTHTGRPCKDEDT